MKAKDSLDKLVAVRIDPKIYEQLEVIAAKEEMDRSVSWLIRNAIEQFISGYKLKSKAKK